RAAPGDGGGAFLMRRLERIGLPARAPRGPDLFEIALPRCSRWRQFRAGRGESCPGPTRSLLRFAPSGNPRVGRPGPVTCGSPVAYRPGTAFAKGVRCVELEGEIE